MDKILIIIPILLYLSAMLFIAYKVNKSERPPKNDVLK